MLAGLKGGSHLEATAPCAAFPQLAPRLCKQVACGVVVAATCGPLMCHPAGWLGKGAGGGLHVVAATTLLLPPNGWLHSSLATAQQRCFGMVAVGGRGGSHMVVATAATCLWSHAHGGSHCVRNLPVSLLSLWSCEASCGVAVVVDTACESSSPPHTQAWFLRQVTVAAQDGGGGGCMPPSQPAGWWGRGLHTVPATTSHHRCRLSAEPGPWAGGFMCSGHLCVGTEPQEAAVVAANVCS